MPVNARLEINDHACVVCYYRLVLCPDVPAALRVVLQPMFAPGNEEVLCASVACGFQVGYCSRIVFRVATGPYGDWGLSCLLEEAKHQQCPSR